MDLDALPMPAIVELERHEMRVLARERELRDLGDALLLFDADDPDPWWNRVASIRWPTDGPAFDRRLEAVVGEFRALGRMPFAWTRPLHNSPPDIHRRLEAAGFRVFDEHLLMVLGEPEQVASVPDSGDRGLPAGVTIERLHAIPPGGVRARAAMGIARVMADAFGPGDADVTDAELQRRADDHAARFDDPAVHEILVLVDDEPAAAARRTTVDGSSYIGAVGTRTAYRGRGLARIATAAAMRDAVAAGSRWTYLSVIADNVPAVRLYRSLGLRAVGRPIPELRLP